MISIHAEPCIARSRLTIAVSVDALYDELFGCFASERQALVQIARHAIHDIGTVAADAHLGDALRDLISDFAMQAIQREALARRANDDGRQQAGRRERQQLTAGDLDEPLVEVGGVLVAAQGWLARDHEEGNASGCHLSCNA